MAARNVGSDRLLGTVRFILDRTHVYGASARCGVLVARCDRLGPSPEFAPRDTVRADTDRSAYSSMVTNNAVLHPI